MHGLQIDDVLSLISPLQTAYVNDDFIDYIIKGVNQCDCTTDGIINIISDNFMSIVDYNSDSFIDYVNDSIESDTVIGIITDNKDTILSYISGDIYNYISDDLLGMISPLKTAYVNSAFIDYINSNIYSDTVINIITDNKDTILNYISGDIYNYISDDVLSLISPLQTAYVNNAFIDYIISNINNDDAVERILADQYPELDVKYILRDYHLIDKHYIELTSNVLTIPTNDLYNPAAAFERFRLLAYVSSDASVYEPLTDLNMLLSANTYQFIEQASGGLMAELSTSDDGLSLLLTGTLTSNISDNSVLWYGFTDLVNPISTAPPDYTVMVSIDCSPNYLKLIDYSKEPAGYMTVPYNNRKSYNAAYATNVRKQFGSTIEVVEVVPHPLLINDQERYIVIRAITDSSNKGYWQYRAANVSNIDAYHYNRKYNKSVLTFSPLESPIMYANVLNGSTTTNYYIYKLDQTFTDENVYNADIYSIDLSNFVPFTSALPGGLTTNREEPFFVNINLSNDNANFGRLQLSNAFNGCDDLASIDLRYIEDYLAANNNTFSDAFKSCVNLNTIFCNQKVGKLISDTYTFTDKAGNARTHSYNAALNALVIGAAQSSSSNDV